MSASSKQPFCYPVCLTCRVTECPKGITPPEKQEWGRDRHALKYLKCGCLSDVIPIVLGIESARKIWCNRHGWQPIPKGKKNESTETERLGADFFTTETGEEIPF